MATRDPHAVLGVERGASQATVKAAWRRLARENHPDVIGSDPASARAATRRMAEINTAYEALPRRSGARPARGPGRTTMTGAAGSAAVAVRLRPARPGR